ncbi:capsular biosynthesis protein [Novosphingobium sp. PC22D]|uniref:polysaccharide biosynthesis/export family protein n=1 Tax=Novosphingobium sp. PC22D TaxID=1962403 RepID=UPI000BF1F7FD|nr:polysaccharide biosynthesis/export family protein [Novosphingobium sp. PC22D]PEQ13803.1 capsular biosynthesis protein [Novosphingobium sp. PC22D]
MTDSSNRAQRLRIVGAALFALSLAGCASLGAPGPTSGKIREAGETDYAQADIQVVELDDRVSRRLTELGEARRFSELFGDGGVSETRIGNGDVLDISVWEAPPAVLFGAGARLGASAQTYGSVAQNTNLPRQTVAEDGTVAIPFVGAVRAAGRSPNELAREIRSRLAGRAHDPQAVVTIAANEARNVTILGEVANSRRVPLGPKGERLLDVIAAAGGSRQPVGKTTVQIARGNEAAAMPLDAIVRDPAQNVRLRPDDVVTVLFQPYSFIALGAVNQNAEVPFEGAGLSLAQALGRIGGLRDERADIRGVFIFRLEDPAVFDPALAATARKTSEGKIPVIYRLDLSDASSFFAAQDFAIRDKDVLYVSVAPAADLPKFLGTISNIAFTTIGIVNLVK